MERFSLTCNSEDSQDWKKNLNLIMMKKKRNEKIHTIYEQISHKHKHTISIWYDDGNCNQNEKKISSHLTIKMSRLCQTVALAFGKKKTPNSIFLFLGISILSLWLFGKKRKKSRNFFLFILFMSQSNWQISMIWLAYWIFFFCYCFRCRYCCYVIQNNTILLESFPKIYNFFYNKKCFLWSNF